MDRKRIVVMGFMAGCPIAGVIWQHLHYIVGLQRLGHEVYYIEDTARYTEDPISQVCTLRDLAEAFDFQDRWAFCARFLVPPQSFGIDLSRLRELYREADAILNVC